MKLRTILIVLALLAFMSASIGGCLYYSSLRKSSFNEAEREADSHARRIANHVSSFLSEYQKAARALAGLEEPQSALAQRSEANLASANSILDHFHHALAVSVCYLMDGNGNTIASSNRKAPDSFVGKNYAFRPYFQQAIQGIPSVYMALGVTSMKRGVYYSHPVYSGKQDTPIGAVVIKASLDPIRDDFSQDRGGIALLIDPHGVIFVSSREDWLYRLAWEPSPEEVSKIADTRQFGSGPWNWVGLKMKNEKQALDRLGNKYLMSRAEIASYQGWHVVYLLSFQTINKGVLDPLVRTSGFTIVCICVLVGLAVLFLYGIASKDIVRRKRAEAALRESEEKFRAITGTAADAIILMDGQGRISYWNPAAEKMFGHTVREAIGQELHLFLAPEEFHSRCKQGFQRFKQTEDGPVIGKTAEFLAVRKDGTEFPMEVSTSALNIKGEWHSVGIIRDISERKRAEEEIKLQKSYFQQLFENSPEACVILDCNDRVVDVNKEFEKLFQYTAAESKGAYINDLIVSNDLFEEASSLSKRALERQAVKRETRRKCKDGTPVDVSILGYPICFNGEQVGIYGIYQDITERKRAEKALRESEKQFRNLVDNALVGVYETDLEGNILYANEALAKMMEFHSIEDMRVAGMLARYNKLDERDTLIRKLRQMGRVDNFEAEFVTNSGAVKNVILTAVLEEDAISGMILDITERKQADEERIRLGTAVEQAAESVIISNRHGTIRYVNPAFQRLSGFSAEEIIGQNFRILKSDRHDEEFYRKMWNTISVGKVWAGRISNRMKDGTLCEFETTISPIRNNSGAIANFVSVNRDVTQEVALQTQLFQAQKMEAVGTLAGGIAHDFNNLLQVVQGYTEILLRGMDGNHPHCKSLRKIEHSAKRGAELTRQLLTFSRKVESKRRPLDLNKEVEQMKELLERTIPKMIEIELHLTPDLGIVDADPIQIEQALVNLTVNAKDAMPDGGRIIIETENATLDERYCRTHLGARPGDYVLLSISDTGHGMNRDILEHIFEPFYSTKEIGRGTGLGLAMVYGIVKNHDGYIMCYSEPDVGSRFKIYLPAVEQEAEVAEATRIEAPVKGGSEKILLIDDEKFIGELGSELLGEAGYQVLTAIDSESALELYRKELDRIDLVILDLIMPGMGGQKCLAELFKINPQAKVLIASGYSMHGPVKDAMKFGARGFIAKPYEAEQMLRLVREVLDQD